MGVRRYQNSDGSLTARGVKRYSDKSPYEVKTADGDVFRVSRGSDPNHFNTNKSKVTKTWGEHLRESDTKKLQEKASKKYKRLSNKVNKEVEKKYNNMYLKAYNNAANYMNSGGIDNFNSQQRKKYGDKFAKRDWYADDYSKVFNKEFAKNFDRSLNDLYNNSKNYKKAEAFAQKYNMTKWDDLARKNDETIRELRSNVKKYM